MKTKKTLFFNIRTWEMFAWILIITSVGLLLTINFFSEYLFEPGVHRGEYITKVLLPCLAALVAVVGMGLSITRTDTLEKQSENMSKALELNEKQFELSRKQFEEQNRLLEDEKLMRKEQFLYQKSIDESNILETRIKNAMEHLGSDNSNVSLGGIYELDSIARDSEKDREKILKILCSYIRVTTNPKNEDIYSFHKEWEDKSFDDRARTRVRFFVQEIINIIFSPEESVYKEYRANLSDSNMQYISFLGLEVNNALFNNSAMHCAQLYSEDGKFETRFNNCSFNYTYLYGVNASLTHFKMCTFSEAKMCWMNLYGSNLKQCEFKFADLTCAVLTATKIDQSSFFKSTLDGAEIERLDIIQDVSFNGASFIFTSIFDTTWLSKVDTRNINIIGVETNRNKYYEGHSRIDRLLMYNFDKSTSKIDRTQNLEWIDNAGIDARKEMFLKIIRKILKYSVKNNNAEDKITEELDVLKKRFQDVI